MPTATPRHSHRVVIRCAWQTERTQTLSAANPSEVVQTPPAGFVSDPFAGRPTTARILRPPSPSTGSHESRDWPVDSNSRSRPTCPRRRLRVYRRRARGPASNSARSECERDASVGGRGNRRCRPDGPRSSAGAPAALNNARRAHLRRARFALRRAWDSNPRWVQPHSDFQARRQFPWRGATGPVKVGLECMRRERHADVVQNADEFRTPSLRAARLAGHLGTRRES
jgi:hypothetical protein